MRAAGFTAALLWASCFEAAPAAADTGEVSGTVHVTALKVGSEFHGLETTVVYLEDGPKDDARMPRGPFEVAQSGKAFHPDVLVVPKGSTVMFPNQDEFMHNVFSQSPGNSFDLGHYRSGTSKSVTFDTPGVVSVYCDVHPQMAASIIVLDNPHFAHPREDGSFRLKSVPPGRYHLVAWFPLGPPHKQEVIVRSGETTSVSVRLRERRAATRHNAKNGQPYGSYGRER